MSQGKRILVVDDDPRLLHQTHHLLLALAPAWQAEAVGSASQGLEAFARQPYDAVLADLRMPGMGGWEFLQEIMARYPATLRILLFEDGERDQALQCLGWAHQFLAKPVQPGYLKSMLEHTTALGARIGNDHVRQLVTRIGQLPAVPELYREVNLLVNSEHSTTAALGQIIAKDMAMTAMILKLTNSAYFGLRQPVCTPAEAVANLGVDLLKALVLAHGLFGQVGAFRIPTFTIQDLWTHSLAVAAAAKRIAEVEHAGSQRSIECFTAGLLHDLGILILASRFPEDYGKVLELTRKAGGDLNAAEQHVFGANHGEVGAYLLALWGLPGPVVDAAACHHTPQANLATGFSPTWAVHLADALHSEQSDHELFKTGHLDLGYLKALGLQDRLPIWRAAILETNPTP